MEDRKVWWFAAALVLLFAVPVMAQDGAAPAIGEDTLTTYVGLAALTVAGVGALKKLWPEFTAGKEPLLAVLVPVLLGVASKAAGVGFADVAWGKHVVALVLTALGAGVAHDKLVNPVMKDKPQPGEGGTPK